MRDFVEKFNRNLCRSQGVTDSVFIGCLQILAPTVKGKTGLSLRVPGTRRRAVPCSDCRPRAEWCRQATVNP